MMIANKISTNAATDFRTRLLLAAEQACATEGLYDARIEDVTRFAGVAKGTFYLYFASKEAIVQAVIQEALRELGERCREASRGARTRSQRSTAIAAAHLDFYRERPGRMRLLHQARGILKFARPEWRPLRRGLEAHLDAVARLLDLPVSFTATERLDAARLLFGATAGVASIFAATDDEGGRGRFPVDGAELIGRMLLDFISSRRRRAGRRDTT